MALNNPFEPWLTRSPVAIRTGPTMNLSGGGGWPWELPYPAGAVAADRAPGHRPGVENLEISVAMVLWTVAAILMLAGFLSEHP